ncbi:unnamed protein product [Clavelina lepadiformis]|uniref:ZP domain-containing protein n=1 Tax=Clavelina lepadiformis TaxID=159417 RepID=A0ABP0G1M4_CLALP
MLAPSFISVKFLMLLALFETSPAQDTVCSPDLCKNSGTCVERPLFRPGFECLCVDGFQGPTCNYRLPDVDCLGKNIILTVMKSLIIQEVEFVDRNFVYLGHGGFTQTDCISEDKGDNLVVTLKQPFVGCGTTMQSEDGNYVYHNRLYLDTTRNTSMGNRELTVLLDWTCVYQSKYNISFEDGITGVENRPEVEVGYGKFTLDMKLYAKPQFDDQSVLQPQNSLLVSGQRVYAKISLISSSHVDLVVSLQSCRASNGANPTEENPLFTHSLLNDGCANDFDPSVTIENSGRSNSARFSFKLFLWSHNPDDPVYLHCIVSICNVTRFDELCRPACLQNISDFENRERRSTKDETISSDVPLTIGPFFLTDKKTLPMFPDTFTIKENETFRKISQNKLKQEINSRRKEGVKTEYIVLGVLVSIGVIIIIVIITAMVYRQHPEHFPEWFSQNSLTKRHHNLSSCHSVTTVSEETCVTSTRCHLQEFQRNNPSSGHVYLARM